MRRSQMPDPNAHEDSGCNSDHDADQYSDEHSDGDADCNEYTNGDADFDEYSDQYAYQHPYSLWLGQV